MPNKNHHHYKDYTQSPLSKYKQQRTRKWRFSKPKILRIIAIAAFLILVIGILGVVGVIAYVSKDLPSPDTLTNRDIAQNTKIYDRNGKLLYEFYGNLNRTLIKIEDVPELVKNATIAVEDANFYNHKGIDFLGIVRSAYLNITRQSGIWGGSTITQQVVKNVLLTPERTYTRKMKEAILSVQIERRYSKNEILQMYLNEVPYGGQIVGIKAASEAYFGKEVKDLTLAEAALLAGLPQQPSAYSPFYGAYPEMAKVRQETVLDLMVKHGLTTQEEADAAKAEELHYATPGQTILAPHFVMYVRDLLVERYGNRVVEEGGLRVTTSLDYDIQTIAEEEVRYQIDRLKEQGNNVNNAGLVAIDPRNGEILAMVGSVDYFNIENDGNVNVTLSLQQPGSSIKPIMYSTALSQGYTAATFLSDIPTRFNDFEPHNWDFRFNGPMLVREALAQSRNIPAVKMLQMVGIDNFLSKATEMGYSTFTNRDQYGLSITLGAAEVKLLEHTSAFGVFANKGIKYNPTAILKVEDPNGKVLDQYQPGDGVRVLDERIAYLITDILSDAVARAPLGINYIMQIRDWRVAVKTGTTNENVDGLTVGYTPNLVAGVWVGNNDNEPPGPVAYGSLTAGPIWHAFMERVLENRDRGEFVRPEGIYNNDICRISGKLPTADCPEKKNELFLNGTGPTEEDDFYKKVEVCTGQGLLATEYDKAVGQTETKLFKQLIEISPAWQPYTDAWMQRSEGYQKAPTEFCTLYHNDSEEPYVKITSPQNKKNPGLSFTVDTEVYSPTTITKVEFYFDGNLEKSLTSAPYSYKMTLSKETEGKHNITVTAYDANGNAAVDEIEIDLGGQPNDGNSDVSAASMDSPENNDKISLPFAIRANVIGQAESVDFFAQKSTGGQRQLIGTAQSSSNGIYSVIWYDNSASGNYDLWVIANGSQGNSVESDKITIKVG